MKQTVLLLTLLLALIAVAAEESPTPTPGKNPAKPTSVSDDTSKEQLEAKFQETLTNAVLKGNFRDVNEDGSLSKEQEDQYTIEKVEKVGEDVWTVWARIQYGKADVTLPVPVYVKWAGDTPVISVTDVGLPGLGTYTARVMVYRDLYTGTWFGPGHGGLMSGTIERKKNARSAGSESSLAPDKSR